MAGTKRKVSNIKDTTTNPPLTNMGRVFTLQRKQGNVSIPRNYLTTQPQSNVVGKVSTVVSGQILSGNSGTTTYGNLPFYATLYQLFGSGSGITWPGQSVWTAKYDATIVTEIEVEITLLNYNTTPTSCFLVPSRALAAAQSNSLQKDYLLPNAKYCVLGLPQSGRCHGKLKHKANISTLYGYDITSTNNSSFLASFTSNPGWLYSGLHFIFMSLDGASIPALDYSARVTMTFAAFSPKQLYV